MGSTLVPRPFQRLTCEHCHIAAILFCVIFSDNWTMIGKRKAGKTMITLGPVDFVVCHWGWKKAGGVKQAVRSRTNVWCGERLARPGRKKATYKRPGWLTAVKRMGMRNALVPGRRPRKFPAPKFNWNHCRTGVTRKKIERQWLIW